MKLYQAVNRFLTVWMAVPHFFDLLTQTFAPIALKLRGSVRALPNTGSPTILVIALGTCGTDTTLCTPPKKSPPRSLAFARAIAGIAVRVDGSVAILRARLAAGLALALSMASLFVITPISAPG